YESATATSPESAIGSRPDHSWTPNSEKPPAISHEPSGGRVVAPASPALIWRARSAALSSHGSQIPKAEIRASTKTAIVARIAEATMRPCRRVHSIGEGGGMLLRARAIRTPRRAITGSNRAAAADARGVGAARAASGRRAPFALHMRGGTS